MPIRIASVWLAIDAVKVEEILGWVDVVRLPGSRKSVPGVLAWQNRAIAVVDLATMLDGEPLTSGRRRTVVVTVNDTTFAIPVDEATAVLEVEDDKIQDLTTTSCPHANSETWLESQPAPIIELEDLVEGLVTE